MAVAIALRGARSETRRRVAQREGEDSLVPRQTNGPAAIAHHQSSTAAQLVSSPHSRAGGPIIDVQIGPLVRRWLLLFLVAPVTLHPRLLPLLESRTGNSEKCAIHARSPILGNTFIITTI